MNLSPQDRLYGYFFIGLSIFGVFGSFTYYLPELFPTRLRATGSGFCYNSGRIVAAIGPFIVGRVSSLGADAEGKVFNINADTIASEIAIQLKAEKLVLLSDVDGIYLRADEPQTKLSRLTADEAHALIEKGSASGGMIPKLQSIVELLRRGVKSAHIINGTARNALLAEVFTDKGTGTMIVSEPRAVATGSFVI